VLEHLNVSGMMKNHPHPQAIADADAGLYEFRQAAADGYENLRSPSTHFLYDKRVWGRFIRHC
jgi:hypothetical protein